MKRNMQNSTFQSRLDRSIGGDGVAVTRIQNRERGKGWMNIVNQMIANRRQELESRLQGTAARTTAHTADSTFQQELSDTNNSTSTEAAGLVNRPSAVDESSTLENVDTSLLNIFSTQLLQLQFPQLDGDLHNHIANNSPQLERNPNVQVPNQPPQIGESSNVQISNQLPQLEESSNSQPISNGRDRWNIMERFNITPVRASNTTKHLDIISEMSKKYGVPIELIQRVIEVESNFQNNARSSAGAQGLMQLMPATARSLGVTNSFNPRQNIEAGVRYLSQHLKNFDGDLVLALAAYNAGIGNVRRHNGVPPFRETMNYIRKITGINVASV